MRDNNFRQDSMAQHDLENDKLDRRLDAALAKFAAAEPRTGLEERILATLRADQKRVASRSWWRWPVLATLAAALVVSVSAAWRSGKPVHTTAANPPALRNAGHAGTQIADKAVGSPIRPHRAESEMRGKTHAISHPATAVASAVKLEQFPSPQPLSEQEKILARYVARYPEHAARIALARTEELRQDGAEELAEATSAGVENSQQWTKKEEQ